MSEPVWVEGSEPCGNNRVGLRHSWSGFLAQTAWQDTNMSWTCQLGDSGRRGSEAGHVVTLRLVWLGALGRTARRHGDITRCNQLLAARCSGDGAGSLRPITARGPTTQPISGQGNLWQEGTKAYIRRSNMEQPRPLRKSHLYETLDEIHQSDCSL